MKTALLSALFAGIVCCALHAESTKVSSPDGKLVVEVNDDGGRANYSVQYESKKFLDASRLGVFANVGDFTQGLKLTGSSFSKIDEHKMF